MHFLEGIRYKSSDNQAESLVDPERDEQHDAGKSEQTLDLAQLRENEQRQGRSRKDRRRPHEGHKLMVPFQSDIEIFEWCSMAGNPAVECGKELKAEQKDVGEHGP